MQRWIFINFTAKYVLSESLSATFGQLFVHGQTGDVEPVTQFSSKQWFCVGDAQSTQNATRDNYLLLLLERAHTYTHTDARQMGDHMPHAATRIHSIERYWKLLSFNEISFSCEWRKNKEIKNEFQMQTMWHRPIGGRIASGSGWYVWSVWTRMSFACWYVSLVHSNLVFVFCVAFSGITLAILSTLARNKEK